MLANDHLLSVDERQQKARSKDVGSEFEVKKHQESKGMETVYRHTLIEVKTEDRILIVTICELLIWIDQRT